MSEKSKGDTSRVVKNPLLSASVTGLTFEDFPNKPLLLPAAPPVVIPPAPLETSEESQKIVTVGQKPNIDAETLSEINLNASVEDDSYGTDNNDKLRDSECAIADESILSQAASSFSQLPTVASSVLSSFSKVIKDYSVTNNTREGNCDKNDHYYSNIPVPNVTESFAQSDFEQQLNQTNFEPPKLYSPSYIPFPSASTSGLPTSGSQNTYRISSKKKVYAQIPGLLTQVPTNQNQVFQSNKSSFTNLIPGQEEYSLISIQANSESVEQLGKQEERKSVFSLSSLVTPVWQNLSGLSQGNDKSEQKGTDKEDNVNINDCGELNFDNKKERKDSKKSTLLQSNDLNLPISTNVLSNSLQLSYTQNPEFEKHHQFINPENNFGSQENFIKKDITSNISKEYHSLPKPPPGKSSGNNFRLQKGTRHYKSALNSFPSNEIISPLSTFSDTYSSSALPNQNNNQLLSSFPVLDPQNINSSDPVKKTSIRSCETLSSNFASTQSHQQEEYKKQDDIQYPIISNFDIKEQKQENNSLPTNTISELNRITPDLKDNFVKQNNAEIFQNEPLFINFGGTQGKEEEIDETKVVLTSTENIVCTSQSITEPVLESVEEIDLEQRDNLPKVSNFDDFILNEPEKTIQAFTNLSSHPTLNVEFHENTLVEKGDKSNIEENLNTNKPQQPLLNFNLANYFDNAPEIINNNQLCTKSVSDIPQVILNSEAIDIINKNLGTSSENIRTCEISADNKFQNTITNYFDSENNTKVIQSSPANNNSVHIPDPLAFFDSFHFCTTTNALNETSTDIEDPNSLRIQDFFNNPPQNLNDSSSDLNYKLVSSGIVDKRLESLSARFADSRNLSPVSNVVEPPSSSCSEFSSEFTSQVIGNLKNITIDDLPEEFLENFKMTGVLEGNSAVKLDTVYTPPVWHWFHKKTVNSKQIWVPFSQIDSDLLEEKFSSEDDGCKIVGVEAGRYDVNISERTRTPVFWTGESTEVRRCSWFYKTIDAKFVPYEEGIVSLLEEEYKEAWISGEWHRKIALPTGETVVFHGPAVLVHFLQSTPASDIWVGTSQNTTRPRLVRRGLEDFNIEAGESRRADHLLLMVHGIGSVCDLKFRPIDEVVDEFRGIALQLIQSHYKNSCESGLVSRIEVLPISWHNQLHSEESGIDEKLKAITLDSVPKLRNFAHDTLLDVLFYTSPIFCQNIINTVANAMNQVYTKYCQRNPDFQGGVSLAGHSLGSLILFDLLCHQTLKEDNKMKNMESSDSLITPIKLNSHHETVSQQVSYTVGPAGTGQPYINYPELIFQPNMFFALGSPIGMFVTIRGIDALGLKFKLPTCPGFFNIFHPYDPVAYRIEALVNPDLSNVRPVLIPHHKGRKRMHLELKETVTRVGADIKQKIFDTIKNTLGSVYYLTSKNKSDTKEIEEEVDKVLEMQLHLDESTMRSRSNSNSVQSETDCNEINLPLGDLNSSRRIDYVLQEGPLEFFNEYIFALTSHVCYWESEDTILFIMKQIYSSLEIGTDSQIPQQSMTIERPNSASS